MENEKVPAGSGWIGRCFVCRVLVRTDTGDPGPVFCRDHRLNPERKAIASALNRTLLMLQVSELVVDLGTYLAWRGAWVRGTAPGTPGPSQYFERPRVLASNVLRENR